MTSHYKDLGIRSIDPGSPELIEHYEGYPSVIMVDEFGVMTGHEPDVVDPFLESGEFNTPLYDHTRWDVDRLIAQGVEELFAEGIYADDQETRAYIRESYNVYNSPFHLEQAK